MRSRVHSTILVVTMLVVGGLGAGAPAEAGRSLGSWPEARAGSARTGWNRQETAISASTVSKLKLRWTDTVASDGEPLVDAARVYVRTHERDAAVVPTLRALDRATGQLVWAVPGTLHVVSNGATVYLMVRRGTLWSGTNTIEVRRASDGALRWSVELPRSGGPDGDYPIGMTLHEGYLVVTGWWYARGVYLIDVSSRTVSRRPLLLDVDAWAPLPTAIGGVVYQAPPVIAVALPGHKAPQLPRHWYLHGGRAAPLIAIGEQLVNVNRYRTVVTDRSGVVQWQSESDPVGNVAGASADAGQLYTVRSLDLVQSISKVTALSLASGRVRWSITCIGRLRAPAGANGLLFVAEGTNGLAALDATTGKVRWSLSGFGNGASPVIANGQLVVGFTARSKDKGSIEHAPVSLFSLG